MIRVMSENYWGETPTAATPAATTDTETSAATAGTSPAPADTDKRVRPAGVLPRPQVERVIAAYQQTASLDDTTLAGVAHILGTDPDAAKITLACLTGAKPARKLVKAVQALIEADRFDASYQALDLVEAGEDGRAAWRMISAVNPTVGEMPRKPRDAARDLAKTATGLTPSRRDLLNNLLSQIDQI